MPTDTILSFKLKEFLYLSKKVKLQAIEMLINSIADDAVYEAKAWDETEKEYKKLGGKQ